MSDERGPATGSERAAGIKSVASRDEYASLMTAYQHLMAQNTRLASKIVHELQIGETDLRVLLLIHYGPGPTPREVAAFTTYSTGAITALVDRLEKRGFIARRPHQTDRRSQTLHLTDGGRSMATALLSTYEEAFESVFTPDEAAMAATIVRRLGEALSRRGAMTPGAPEESDG